MHNSSMTHCGAQQYIAPLVLISFIAIIVGCWFSHEQIYAVSASGAQYYPITYYYLTIFKSYLTIVCIYLATYLLLRTITNDRISLLQLALCFIPLILIPFGFSILSACTLISLIILISFYKIDGLKSIGRHFISYRTDYIAFMIITVLNLLLTSRFSPLFWGNAILAEKGYNSEEVAVLAPIFKGYLLAKQYSFSFLDHAQWAGIMHPPGNLNSPLLQLLVLTFDLPSVSYYDFHALILLLFLALGIFGSMGTYLLLKYSYKVTFLFSLFGGLLFFFGGAPLMDGSFATDAGIFLPPQALFPWVLLMANASYMKRSLKFAVYVGVFLAAQFFILTPHPEGTIYMMGSYLLYSAVMSTFSADIKVKTRILLFLIPLITFFLLSLFYLAPVLYDRFTGDMYVFAHTGDVTASNLRYIKRYLLLAIISIPYTAYIFSLEKRITPQYLSLVVLCVSLVAFTLLTMNVNFSLWLIAVMHIGLHFWVPTRLGLYLIFTVILLTVIALDLFTRRTLDTVYASYKKILGIN